EIEYWLATDYPDFPRSMARRHAPTWRRVVAVVLVGLMVLGAGGVLVAKAPPAAVLTGVLIGAVASATAMVIRRRPRRGGAGRAARTRSAGGGGVRTATGTARRPPADRLRTVPADR